jgi:hypothetical protein
LAEKDRKEAGFYQLLQVLIVEKQGKRLRKVQGAQADKKIQELDSYTVGISAARWSFERFPPCFPLFLRLKAW